MKDTENIRDCFTFNKLLIDIINILGAKCWTDKVNRNIEQRFLTNFDVCHFADGNFVFNNSKKTPPKTLENTKDNNKSKVYELLKTAETEASTQGSNYLTVLGSIIFIVSADNEWTGELFKKAEKKAKSFLDFLNLAENVIIKIKDNKWAIDLYKKAEKRAEDFNEFALLAKHISEYIKDKKYVDKLLKEAEKRAESSFDITKVAANYAMLLNDNNKAGILYRKAEEDIKSEAFVSYLYLAQSVAEDLKDIELGRIYFKKSQEYASSSYDFRRIAAMIFHTLGDRVWTRELFEKAESLSSTPEEFYLLSDNINSFLKDSKWIKSIHAKAKKAENASELLKNNGLIAKEVIWNS